MRLRYSSLLLILSSLFLLNGCAKLFIKKRPLPYAIEHLDKKTRKAYERTDAFLRKVLTTAQPVAINPGSRIDTIIVDQTRRTIRIDFTAPFSYIPFRPENTAEIYQALRHELGRPFREYALSIHTLGRPIEELIPNIFRTAPAEYDSSRLPLADAPAIPLVRNLSRPWQVDAGLQDRHIALWHSHGWYYEQQKDRWEWQRARLFQTVEDLLSASFVLPYLVPMLENAGATVFLPRERDPQRHEVIVDNDSSSGGVYREVAEEGFRWWSTADSGFAIGSPPYDYGVNPFRQGSGRETRTDTISTARIEWIPDIPERGDYAVYISWIASDSNSTDARYTVYHAGDSTVFLINQQLAGKTWVYLGTFTFEKGLNPAIGKVVLENRSTTPGMRITADAVRFGGGMGIIARNGRTSMRPKFFEAARYFLQYSGAPDSLVYSLTKNENDYRDDYLSRGEWVNYLAGTLRDSSSADLTSGLDIPIDLSLAFHTDAGIVEQDSIFGTLMIYSHTGMDSVTVFPDGVSRFASRDFGDILQTQIVEDLRALHAANWTRRGIWDMRYSEAFRPNVPAALLELLSHQNLNDMLFAHDPRFKFDAARAVYKAILRFLAFQHGQKAVVQPLPVSHARSSITSEGDILLQWRPVQDPIEPDAAPDAYVVYTRRDGGAFDGGTLVHEPEFILRNPDAGTIYGFRITAVNAGGQSFPSEELSVCIMDTARAPVAIINAFDRVSAPASIRLPNFAGFADFLDQGVPYGKDFSFTGAQFDFNPYSRWTDDDSPGHGASYADYETTLIAGNTFDFSAVHGEALRAAGYGFVTISDEAVMDSLVDLRDYAICDIIFGEEKTTRRPGRKEVQYELFPRSMQQQIARFLLSGGKLFASGAYIATDLLAFRTPKDPNRLFGNALLHIRHRTNHAARTGVFYSSDTTFLNDLTPMVFNTRPGPDIYAVEAPDGIEPVGANARVLLRYRENNIAAAVGYKGTYSTVIMGFPFETVLTREARLKLMQAILRFLEEPTVSTANFD